MDKWLNSREWEELLRENPELARDLEAFFRNESGGVASVVGFYSILKMRLWRFLTTQRSRRTAGEAQADEETPPHSAAAS